MDEVLLAVSDANVLIDLEEGRLLASLFELTQMKFCVPDVLFEEELREHHGHLLTLGLKLEKLSGDSVAKIFRLAQKHRKVSRLDLFALQLALEQSCLLLTGDRLLRKLAESLDVECHGTLWLVEQIVIKGVISFSDAREGYLHMKLAGSRLPWSQAEERLQEVERHRR